MHIWTASSASQPQPPPSRARPPPARPSTASASSSSYPTGGSAPSSCGWNQNQSSHQSSSGSSAYAGSYSGTSSSTAKPSGELQCMCFWCCCCYLTGQVVFSIRMVAFLKRVLILLMLSRCTTSTLQVRTRTPSGVPDDPAQLQVAQPVPEALLAQLATHSPQAPDPGPNLLERVLARTAKSVPMVITRTGSNGCIYFAHIT